MNYPIFRLPPPPKAEEYLDTRIGQWVKIDSTTDLNKIIQNDWAGAFRYWSADFGWDYFTREVSSYGPGNSRG